MKTEKNIRTNKNTRKVKNKLNKNIMIYDIIYYDDNYILDNSYIYISCGPIHDNRNIGDWFNTIVHHITFNLKNNFDIIICVNTDCLQLAKILVDMFDCIKKILISDNMNIINKYTSQNQLHYDAMINRFNNNFKWVNIKTNWHDIHYNFLYTLELLINDNYFDIFKNTIIKFQTIVKKIDNINYKNYKNYKNTLCIYPYRSDGHFISEDIIINFCKNLKFKKLIIHINKKFFKINFKELNIVFNSIIQKYNVKFVTFDFIQLFIFVNNYENILFINRSGLSEILYWSNARAQIYVYIPKDLIHFSYEKSCNNNIKILEKFQNLNITKGFKDVYELS